MDKVTEYERHSIECRDYAAKAPGADIRSHYLSLARMWQQLAEERRSFLQLKCLD
ncbi:MAG TPA: hypothetical protein VH189_07770 [Rhizomicrobium sp.]|nr:hypothetical protein [Rhizomicrobium sp.]